MKLKEFINELKSMHEDLQNEEIYCMDFNGKKLEINAFAAKEDGFYLILNEMESKCKGKCKCKQKTSADFPPQNLEEQN
jgi:hypothetical protein